MSNCTFIIPNSVVETDYLSLGKRAKSGGIMDNIEEVARGQDTMADAEQAQEEAEALNTAPIVVPEDEPTTEEEPAEVSEFYVEGETLSFMRRLAKRGREESMRSGKSVSLAFDVVFKKSTSVFYGNSGSGKTKMAVICALEVLEQNEDYNVLYMALDPSVDQIIEIGNEIEARELEDRFILIERIQASKVLETMESLAAETPAFIKKAVLVIDTMKKIVSVNQKDLAAEIMEQLRVLRSKGLTIILLAHTNKDGQAMSGVADFAQDSDNILRVDGEYIGEDEMKVSIAPSEGSQHRCRMPVKPFSVLVGRDDYSHTVTDDHINKAAAEAVIKAQSQMGNMGQVAVAIVAEYAEQGAELNKTMLYEELKGSETYTGIHKKESVFKHIDRLARSGVIVEKLNGRKKLYEPAPIGETVEILGYEVESMVPPVCDIGNYTGRALFAREP